MCAGSAQDRRTSLSAPSLGGWEAYGRYFWISGGLVPSLPDLKEPDSWHDAPRRRLGSRRSRARP
eukprot:scaffold29250_cov56-Isochrysis_galbana.AAC.1